MSGGFVFLTFRFLSLGFINYAVLANWIEEKTTVMYDCENRTLAQGYTQHDQVASEVTESNFVFLDSTQTHRFGPRS